MRREREEQSVERLQCCPPASLNSKDQEDSRAVQSAVPAASRGPPQCLCFLTGRYVIPAVFLRGETIIRADIHIRLHVDCLLYSHGVGPVLSSNLSMGGLVQKLNMACPKSHSSKCQDARSGLIVGLGLHSPSAAPWTYLEMGAVIPYSRPIVSRTWATGPSGPCVSKPC